MNLKSDIQRYLSGEGYYIWGIQLLEQLSHDEAEVSRLRAFSRDTYAPSWAEERIEILLKQYLNKPGPQFIIQTQQAYDPQSTTPNPQTHQEDPQVIKVLKEEVKILLKTRANWHAQMKATARTNERHKAHCATEIIHITHNLDHRYTLLNNWYEHQIIPPLIATTETSTDQSAAAELAELIKQERSIAPRVSKIKSLLKGNLSDKRATQLKSELAEKQSTLDTIKAKLIALKTS